MRGLGSTGRDRSRRRFRQPRGSLGHLVIEAADYTEAETASIAGRVREHRVSVVLNLEGLEIDAQLRCAGAFLNRLFDAPRAVWYPVLVVVDEAQLFAPAAAGKVGEDARRASLAAMTNLMCRGRKRGLAGVIATQGLAKLAKNVAAEASNFLMGRTFLDIDMQRAADLLGMERRQAEQIRDLARGQFLALGSAISRRPQLMRIGGVQTGSRGAGPNLAPLPDFEGGDRRALLFKGIEEESARPMPQSRAIEPVEQLLNRMTLAETSVEDGVDLAGDVAPIVDAVLRDIIADEDAAHHAPGSLFQDFAVRCRMRGIIKPPLAPAEFARSLSLARANIFPNDLADESWSAALAIADTVPEDMLGVFMLIARAARDEAPCPSEAEIARVYGTHSIGRIRRLLGYMETRNYLALRVDLRGRRTAAIPGLGWSTAPEESSPSAH